MTHTSKQVSQVLPFDQRACSIAPLPFSKLCFENPVHTGMARIGLQNRLVVGQYILVCSGCICPRSTVCSRPLCLRQSQTIAKHQNLQPRRMGDRLENSFSNTRQQSKASLKSAQMKQNNGSGSDNHQFKKKHLCRCDLQYI